MITHKGFEFYGTASSPHIEQVNLQAWRNQFPGVIGISELMGGPADKVLEFDLWTHRNFNTSSALWDYLILIDSHVGENGELAWSLDPSGATASLRDVTFDGWRLLWGPLPDYAKTVDGGWVANIMLMFTSLVNSQGLNA